MDQPPDWIDLSELPEELKANIISRESDNYVKIPFISKGVSNASKLHRLKTGCLKPITSKELDKYKSSYEPPLICQMAYGSSGDGTYYVGIFLNVASSEHFSYSYGSSYLYGRYYEYDNYVGITYQLKDEVGDNIINYNMDVRGDDDSIRLNKNAVTIGYDLITTYYVMKERESCMNINSGFAKRVVLDTLNDWKEVYDINKAIFLNDRKRNYEELNEWLYDFYTFLRCNAMIIGFSIKSSTTMDTNFHDEDYLIRFENRVMELIEQYYTFIRKHLRNLDDTALIDKEFRYILGSE